MKDVFAELTAWLKSDECQNEIEKAKAEIKEELQVKEKAWENHKRAILKEHGELVGNLILLQELNEAGL